MLGQAGGRAKITPERIAVNLDHCEACDNDGEQRIDSVIHPEGPAAYFSTLPVHAMLQEMRKYEVGCAMSASAGAFVCNHVSYEALHYISRMGYGIPAGFIHLFQNKQKASRVLRLCPFPQWCMPYKPRLQR